MRAAANATAARNRNLHRRDSPRLRAQRGRPTRCDDGAGSGFARLLHQAFTIGTPFQGFSKWPSIIPGRCPGLWLNRPFGATARRAPFPGNHRIGATARRAGLPSPKGAPQYQPRATPWETDLPIHQSPERARQHTRRIPKPQRGGTTPAQGNALGNRPTNPSKP